MRVRRAASDSDSQRSERPAPRCGGAVEGVRGPDPSGVALRAAEGDRSQRARPQSADRS